MLATFGYQNGVLTNDDSYGHGPINNPSTLDMFLGCIPVTNWMTSVSQPCYRCGIYCSKIWFIDHVQIEMHIRVDLFHVIRKATILQ